MNYRLLYSETSRKQIRKLHPLLKTLVKARLEQIGDDPYIGIYLERDLSGYLSFAARRYRIIYKISEDEGVVEVHYVGHRKDIYELFSEQILSRRS